jgi:AAA+ ATPase superfamily predicted ATPase
MLAVERKHLAFKHSFTRMNSGPKSSGKTALIRGFSNIIKVSFISKIN